jgi:hypothetical protein
MKTVIRFEFLSVFIFEALLNWIEMRVIHLSGKFEY